MAKKIIIYISDEYQDTSSSQNSLLNMLQGYHKNLMVVGDPDQNIYSWRGARVEYIIDFDKKYVPTKDTYITLNYRSTPQILSNANSLIKHNNLRLEKDLIPTIENGEKVVHFYAKNEKEESEFVCNEIKKLVDSGTLLRNIAILYRASYLSRSIEQELIRSGIKYKVYSGIRFFQREEIKDIIAYLKILDSDVIDDLSLMRIINKPTRNLSLKKIKEIKEQSENMGVSCFEIIKNNSYYRTEKINELFKTINTFKKEKSNYKTIWELTKEYLDAVGYIKYREDLNEEERLENIAEMMDSIRLYEEENRYENISLSSYLQEIALYTSADEIKDIDSVSLMTIHTAKGLEFDVIFSIGWNDGVLPSKKTLEQFKKPGLEEERRLAYVAMTRAKKRLFISNSNYSSRKSCVPSRFLIELDEEMLERRNCTFESLSEEIKSNIENDYESIDLENNSISKISIGDYVNHSFFGKGKIEEMDETTLYIEFKKDKGKLKPVLKTFKGLEIIDKESYENEEL